ncbi:hypothetical protein L2109_23210 [Citrobacter portucalensis]|nr:hypothetical protein [Citrobacter portucalensis]MDE9666389.1 hypothetical protein [Citrobacter portucalensis]MDE9676208.1 hypothetical protein [Citrobacter portucalensis]
MSSQSIQLVKAIADIAIALEFTDENLIHPDVAIEMQENIAGTLQALDEVNREDIADVFESISTHYNGEIANYVRSLPANYGIK